MAPVFYRCVRPYALVTCSLTTLQPFSLSLEKADTIPIGEGPACSICERRCSWTSKPTVLVSIRQVGTGFIQSNWPKSSTRNCAYRGNGR